MMTMADLSLDQTPPLDLPLRLFLTAPLFAAAAGAVLMIDAEAVIATRWSPAALAATHLITLGLLGQVMIGALLLFHVTPAYPRWMTRALVPTLFLALCVITALPLLPPSVGPVLWLAALWLLALLMGATRRYRAAFARLTVADLDQRTSSIL